MTKAGRFRYACDWNSIAGTLSARRAMPVWTRLGFALENFDAIGEVAGCRQ